PGPCPPPTPRRPRKDAGAGTAHCERRAPTGRQRRRDRRQSRRAFRAAVEVWMRPGGYCLPPAGEEKSVPSPERPPCLPAADMGSLTTATSQACAQILPASPGTSTLNWTYQPSGKVAGALSHGTPHVAPRPDWMASAGTGRTPLAKQDP